MHIYPIFFTHSFVDGHYVVSHIFFIIFFLPRQGSHACNSTTQTMKIGESRIKGQTQPYSKFEVT